MKSMYLRKRFHGASDEWGNALCLRCNRRINLTRRGQLRKHVASPGVTCVGSWEWQDIQKARIEAADLEAAEHSVHPTGGRRGAFK